MRVSGGHPLAPHLLAEVDAVVGGLRAGYPCELDIAAIAAASDVVVREDDLGGSLDGLTLDARRVLLDCRLGKRKAFVFAHELAHVLRRRGQFRSVTREDEEWFADWFARELVLPRRWLGEHDALSLVQHVGADLDVLALQLAALGRAPSVMRWHSEILCALCGAHPYRWGCECREWRRTMQRDPDCLADISYHLPRALAVAGPSHDERPRLPDGGFDLVALRVIPSPTTEAADAAVSARAGHRRAHRAGLLPGQLALADG